MTDTAYFHTLSPYLVQIYGSFGIRWYGLAYLVGFLSGYYIILALSKRKLTPIPPHLVGDFVFDLAVGCIVGGRLGYCLFYSPDLLVSFRPSFPFWGVLALNEGGMASHGGFLGLFFTCIWFGRKHNLSFLPLCDLVPYGGVIGVFFGRIANFINGELVGRAAPEGYKWAVKFPQDILMWPTLEPAKLRSLTDVVAPLGVDSGKWTDLLNTALFDRASFAKVDNLLFEIVTRIQDGDSTIGAALQPLLTARYPSQLFEAILEGLVLFVLLTVIWMKPRKPGVIGGWFFVLYSIVRIIGEHYRLPDPQIGFQILGLTRGQILSGFFLIGGIVMLIVTSFRKTPKIGGWFFFKTSETENK